jgi:hypothetical protein
MSSNLCNDIGGGAVAGELLQLAAGSEIKCVVARVPFLGIRLTSSARSRTAGDVGRDAPAVMQEEATPAVRKRGRQVGSKSKTCETCRLNAWPCGSECPTVRQQALSSTTPPPPASDLEPTPNSESSSNVPPSSMPSNERTCRVSQRGSMPRDLDAEAPQWHGRPRSEPSWAHRQKLMAAAAEHGKAVSKEARAAGEDDGPPGGKKC